MRNCSAGLTPILEPEPSEPGAIIWSRGEPTEEGNMNELIYLVGLIVVIMAILSLFGLR